MALATLALACVALLAAAGSATANCVKPQRVEFAHGPSPIGPEWTAEAGIKKNGRCGTWLFSGEFRGAGTMNWGSATGIPVGGHTDRYFEISGFNFPVEGRDEGVIGGYVGREVASAKLSMSDGSTLELHPKLPPEKLRQKHVWMRGFRYFVRYYPGTGHVTALRLFDHAGTLLYRKLHTNGELW